MSGGAHQSMFFLSLPDLKKLCCVTLTLQEEEEEPRSKQMKTCRELVLLYSDVLASPALDSFSEITVVMAVSFFQKGFLQVFGRRRWLQVSPPQCVFPGTLQACLSYSLITRLAPSWNKAGLFLISGKDFLSEGGRLSAVSMELSTTEGQLCVSIEANTVRLPPTTLEDFDLSPLVLRRFCCDPDAVLHPSSTGGAIWCHVLPSMKKGQIITISRQLPEDGPFRTYRDLQNHWNHLYGYRLPDLAEEEVVYCSVYFRLVGDRLFTYPLSCIRLQPVQHCPHVDLQGALGCFLSDIRDRLQNVCNFPAQLSSKPCYRSVSVNTAATVQVLSGDQINLTSTCSIRQVLTQLPPPHPQPVQTSFGSQSPAWTPLSQQDGVQRILGNRLNRGRLTQSQGSQRDKVWPPLSSLSSSSSSLSSSSRALVSFSSPYSSVFRPAPSLSSSSSSSSLPPPILPPPELVPIFKNKCSSRRVNVAALRAQKQREQLIGGQKEKRRVTFSVLVKETPTTTTTTSSSSVPAVPHPPTLPRFNSHPKPQSSSFPPSAGHHKLKHLFSFSPASKSKPAPATSPGPEIQSEPKSSNKTSMRASLERRRGDLQEEATKQPATAPAETSDSHTDGVVLESKMKKSKSVRRDADVEKMARSNQLSKLSSSSLLTWLKARGATVSAKHKREELMLKVMSCLAEA